MMCLKNPHLPRLKNFNCDRIIAHGCLPVCNLEILSSFRCQILPIELTEFSVQDHSNLNTINMYAVHSLKKLGG